MKLQRNLSGWLALLTRFVGVAGLIYEIGVDQLRNPTALVVFGGLSGLPDVLGYRAGVKQEVEQENEDQEERRRRAQDKRAKAARRALPEEDEEES